MPQIAERELWRTSTRTAPQKISWAEWDEQIYAVIIEDGVTEIGECAFYDLEQLTDVTFPNTLEKIGNFAFQNTGITEINLGENVVSIGMNSFAACDNLTHVTLNENLKIIGKEAFYYSDNLKTLYIPPSVTTIVDWAYGFRMTSNGDWLGIPDETKTIQGYQGSYAETYAYENGVELRVSRACRQG
ncbi:MAG: leucine-rich repeat domain-containing protein [Ruminococcus flavefaciens]|nr:leucine-rich repeat domain-containing protein [Ruminococcus flavefaciens]